MANILLATSILRGSGSYSNKIAEKVLSDLHDRAPDAPVTVRDLAQAPLPCIDDDFVPATRGREGPQSRRLRTRPRGCTKLLTR